MTRLSLLGWLVRIDAHGLLLLGPVIIDERSVLFRLFSDLLQRLLDVGSAG